MTEHERISSHGRREKPRRTPALGLGTKVLGEPLGSK
jgi:hypothetical protein